VNKEIPVIYGDGNQYRDFVYVADVVRANLHAASSSGACGKVINVGTGGSVRINQLWRIVARMAGSESDPEYRPSRPGDILESVAEIGCAEKFLGYQPKYSFEEGLEMTFRWYVDNLK
ncbi:MAG: NAD-dependent epimerase/dehydratase family protein, partial [bacterium]|nr:NAD-dependent epimerase/dehydratase family protein [bacterium]